MEKIKTPGVYIVEQDAFSNSVVPVPTAVPAFVGYTEKIQDGHKSLLNVPVRISSMPEYEQYFGKGPKSIPSGSIKDVDEIEKVKELKAVWFGEADPVKRSKAKKVLDAERRKHTDYAENDIYLKFCASSAPYTLYYHLILFFANGGGSCYVVSVGEHQKGFTANAFKGGIDVLQQVAEPTMLVIPEAVNLADWTSTKGVYEKALSHCGEIMKNRVAILDIYDGNKPYDGSDDLIKQFRKIDSVYLDYGVAYYPWLETAFIDQGDVKKETLSYTIYDALLHILYGELGDSKDDNGHNLRRFELHYQYELIKNDGSIIGDAKKKLAKDNIAEYIGRRDPDTVKEAQGTHGVNYSPTRDEILAAVVKKLLILGTNENKTIVEAVLPGSELWKRMAASYLKKLNCLPPCSAIAGVYAKTDQTRGVWKAPANIALNSIVGLPVNISDEMQKDLNMPLDGKAVNAIRSFAGEGIKVWGARTLNGNSQDWRYVNVRRTMIFLEQSLKNAAAAYVFEPNDANTWLRMKCSIDNFLHDVWQQGGLVGVSPKDAYSVHVGLGDTMTADDILKGIVRIVVLVAVSHPGEFIEITFQQQIQES